MWEAGETVKSEQADDFLEVVEISSTNSHCLRFWPLCSWQTATEEREAASHGSVHSPARIAGQCRAQCVPFCVFSLLRIISLLVNNLILEVIPRAVDYTSSSTSTNTWPSLTYSNTDTENWIVCQQSDAYIKKKVPEGGF